MGRLNFTKSIQLDKFVHLWMLNIEVTDSSSQITRCNAPACQDTILKYLR
ncbi:hypothetical protein SBF1_2850002 [Candidatus Desulfosporosinus infrequens]|uniref:Uncharacterized protein n=1 Tax=Candidatus Desulfosporosinus infrequens TaxID=2043169 RepID=A0A2U3KUW5_9FIRM|nr:hypothetical protein SBF1_2850002 [Candidatus Desulfosporosinus infrequens]